MPRADTTPDSRPSAAEPRIALLEFAALLAWSLVLFGSLLPGDYLADDYSLIAKLAGPGGGLDWSALPGLWSQEFGPFQPLFVRPIWRASFVLDFHFVEWGWGAPASRLVDFTLHAACAWLLLRWLHVVGVPRAGARFAAFLAVVLPLPTEAVVWIAARCDLLASGGVLLALWSRARALGAATGPSARLEAVVWASMVLALWSKESAAAGGLALLAQEFVHPARRHLPLGERLRASRGFLMRGAGVALALAAHRYWMLGELGGGYVGGGATGQSLQLAAGKTFSTLAFPLAYLVDLPRSAQTAMRVAVVASALLLALFAWRRAPTAVRLASLWLLGAVWILNGLFVDSPLGPNTRFLYQPALALCGIFGATLAALLPAGGSSANPTPRALVQAMGVGLILVALAFHRPAIADYAVAQRELAEFRTAVSSELERRPEGAVLTGLPDYIEGRAVCGLNVYPALFHPPFMAAPPGGGRHPLAGLGGEDGAEGRLLTNQLMVLLRPGSEILEWSEGALRPRGPLEPSGEPRPRFGLRHLGAGSFRVEGLAPQSGVVFLAGAPGAGTPLGAAGTFELSSARILAQGASDEHGALELRTPKALIARAMKNGIRFQALAFEEDLVRVSEVVVLDASR
ncbi:MAG: hypothetical protein AAFZ65_08090 [Planctomycetota bacterium]